MSKRPPPLTPEQKSRVQQLEPALRSAVRKGEYQAAKRYVAELQAVLRPTGHETRLMQAKNWLFQAAMESGQLTIAIQGFTGVRAKVSPRTRVYLEATALLAICYLRQKDVATAEPLMAEVLRSDSVIRSERRRRQFRRRLIDRFEEEGMLAALASTDSVLLDAAQVQEDAITAISTKNDDEMLVDIGTAVPPQVLEILLRIHDFSSKQLPPGERKLLQPPQQVTKRHEVGQKVLTATQRVVWKALCDPKNEVYQLWHDGGLQVVLNKKAVASGVLAALAGTRIGLYALAVTTTAMILKMGLNVMCDVWRPEGIMIHLDEE